MIGGAAGIFFCCKFFVEDIIMGFSRKTRDFAVFSEKRSGLSVFVSQPTSYHLVSERSLSTLRSERDIECVRRKRQTMAERSGLLTTASCVARSMLQLVHDGYCLPTNPPHSNASTA